MSRKRSRLARLEKEAAPIIDERRRKAAEQEEGRYQAARDHAMMVATVVLHGEPKPDEPLLVAWLRATERLGFRSTEPVALDDLRHRVLAPAPGDTETGKLAHVLSSAPPWLLSFCWCTIDAHILGIDLPRGDKVSEPGQNAFEEMSRRRWPQLPQSAYTAGGPVPDLDLSGLETGFDPFAALSDDEILELSELEEKGEENWSRLERRRHREIRAKVTADPAVQAWLGNRLGDPNNDAE